MVARGVMLGAVIPPVVTSWGPIETELAPDHAATEPVEAKVHGLDFAGDDGIVDYARRRGVVCLQGRRGLRPSHLGEGLAHRHHFLGGDEEGTELGLGGGGHDGLDNLGDREDGPIPACTFYRVLVLLLPVASCATE